MPRFRVHLHGPVDAVASVDVDANDELDAADWETWGDALEDGAVEWRIDPESSEPRFLEIVVDSVELLPEGVKDRRPTFQLTLSENEGRALLCAIGRVADEILGAPDFRSDELYESLRPDEPCTDSSPAPLARVYAMLQRRLERE